METSNLLNFNQLAVQQQLFRPQLRHGDGLIVEVHHHDRVVPHPLATVLLQLRLAHLPRPPEDVEHVEIRQVYRDRAANREHDSAHEQFTSKNRHFRDYMSAISGIFGKSDAGSSAARSKTDTDCKARHTATGGPFYLLGVGQWGDIIYSCSLRVVCVNGGEIVCCWRLACALSAV